MMNHPFGIIAMCFARDGRSSSSPVFGQRSYKKVQTLKNHPALQNHIAAPSIRPFYALGYLRPHPFTLWRHPRSGSPRQKHPKWVLTKSTKQTISKHKLHQCDFKQTDGHRLDTPLTIGRLRAGNLLARRRMPCADGGRCIGGCHGSGCVALTEFVRRVDSQWNVNGSLAHAAWNVG